MGEVDYESLPTDKLWAHLLAGGAAGVTEHCVMYPVDCVKVCMCVCVLRRRGSRIHKDDLSPVQYVMIRVGFVPR